MLRIIYSLDGSYYYIDGNRLRPQYWLGVEKITTPRTPEMEKAAFKGYAEITLKETGERYIREALPFTFWKVRSGKKAEISITDDLVLDYAVWSGWSKKELESAASPVTVVIDAIKNTAADLFEKASDRLKGL